MTSTITQNIEVSVRPQFLESVSVPEFEQFAYSYEITITNRGMVPVQLLSRQWVIKEFPGKPRVVSGLGVVGVQPLIHPHADHVYASGCQFNGPVGMMVGHYKFARMDNGSLFMAKIPPFWLIYPPLLN
ncbi:MAG: Co2+/Mg2+ efflux protein ApaG [Bacteroidetes bacterium]|jgi:ApaG protein|nr:Co2+/Mg2+ efflux protein ApaG [Bacteroidota bacterium]